MKKTSLSIAGLFTMVMAFGQGADRTSAIMAYKDFTKAAQEQNYDKAEKSIKEAKEYIDKAYTAAPTDPKTLFYKGEIYTSYPLTMIDPASMAGAKDPCSAKPKFKAGIDEKTGMAESEKYMKEGLDAYKQSIANKNKKDDFTDQINFKMNLQAITVFNCGSQMFNAKDYKKASEYFMQSATFKEAMGQKDSISYYNSALCFERLKDYDNAAAMWQKCTEVKYGGADAYSGLANAYRNAGKEEDALKAIKAGKSVYPKDQGLIISEVNYHLGKGNNAEAEKSINEAIALDPKNPTLYFALGSVYDNLANPKAEITDGMTKAKVEELLGKPKSVEKTTIDGVEYELANFDKRRVIYDKDLVKKVTGDREVALKKPAQYAEYISKAENSYKKATELDAKYFDAWYNLGALKYNEGAELINKIKDISDDAIYNAEKAKADDLFKAALPHNEKAREINPKDKDNLMMLKNIYARLGNMEKVKEINDLLKN